ncbi:hypothetical protein [Burkholderia stabilis]|uniref:hypothetical protein n=1 Tax=Burkholderia stabilis TaxID=95485 RepID=UPI001592072F|nr:hypothetical protein [Burkholderia stabilis]
MIEEEGFLSRDMDGYIAAIREDFAEEISGWRIENSTKEKEEDERSSRTPRD